MVGRGGLIASRGRGGGVSQPGRTSAPRSVKKVQVPTGLPSFEELCQEMASIFENVNKGGKPAKFGFSACSMAGKTFSQGDSHTYFPLGKSSWVFSYLICSEENGEKLDELIGHETVPENQEFAFTQDHKAPNPFVLSGAFLATTKIASKSSPAERISNVLEKFGQLSGERTQVGMVAYNMIVSSPETDLIFAVGHWLAEKHMIEKIPSKPGDPPMRPTAELFFQINSIEASCETGAIMAATLASGGVSPISKAVVFKSNHVSHALSTLKDTINNPQEHSLGVAMKSGKSGVIILFIPGFLGLCVWSPILENGLSAKGFEFVKALLAKFPVLTECKFV